MSEITDMKALEVIDSRGNPTIQAIVKTAYGGEGVAMVPSGASTGIYEAVELRDNDPKRYLGKGVIKAVKFINEDIADELMGVDVTNQKQIDDVMMALDGTENKSRLGANAILAVSLACVRAAADQYHIPLYRYIGGNHANALPVPMMNILNGGSHADNGIDFQEFMIIPANADTFSEALRMGIEVFHNLKSVLHSQGLSTNVGDEGGFAPNIKNNEQALEGVLKSIEKAGYRPGEDVFIALDAASSEFYDKKEKVYHFKKSDGTKKTSEELIEMWADWCNKYPIVSLEDGLDEDDWEGWKKLTQKLGNKVQLVGDDLFVTHSKRLKRGIDAGVANSILVKVNQIGSLSETIEAVKMGYLNGYTAVISHRSGETEDTTIADLSVALETHQIKTGSASRTDRIAKYNRLLKIEDELGSSAKYAGKSLRFIP